MKVAKEYYALIKYLLTDTAKEYYSKHSIKAVISY